MALSKESILSHTGDVAGKTREVHVPAWRDASGDDVVLVRGMTVREYEVHSAWTLKKDGKATAALVSRCVVDASGSRLFDDKDIPRIAELGLEQMDKIAEAILELSGIKNENKPKSDDDESEDEAEGEDEQGKDSPNASDGSDSELRVISA